MKDIRQLTSPVITGKPQTAATRKPTVVGAPRGQSFGEIFRTSMEQERATPLTLSKHAQQRAQQRGIELTGEDMQRLEQAVDKAGDKGITDTLVFMNNTAFIVNVPSKVVVTMMDGTLTEPTVLTNINGAVLI